MLLGLNPTTVESRLKKLGIYSPWLDAALDARPRANAFRAPRSQSLSDPSDGSRRSIRCAYFALIHQLLDSTGQRPPKAREERGGSHIADVLRERAVSSRTTPTGRSGGAGRDRCVRRATHGDAGARSSGREVEHMDLTTIVIVLLVVAVLGGGGWGYSRWRG
jgi:hypothetical protein